MTDPTRPPDDGFDPDPELRDLAIDRLAQLEDPDRRTRRVAFLMAVAAARRLEAQQLAGLGESPA
ncbi:MAG TPA: hypothetical protein VH439_17375 [Gemmatimonadales bacterium]|jgi:hypothetical protein